MISAIPNAAGEPLRWVTVGSIRAYQRWISPYKGFRCAHHALHGEGSCSHFGLEAFRSQSFGAAWTLTADRLRACRQAYLVLAEQAGEETGDAPKKRRGGDTSGGSLADALCCGVEIIDACL